jgi:hypothetical protein
MLASNDDRRSARRRAAVAFALALVPYLAFVAWFDFVTDDAYIDFRFARNLARGLGFVWNPGVDPPVEGTSQFLWVLALAAIEYAGLDPVVWSRVLSVIAGVALLWRLASFLARDLDLPLFPAAAACLWTAILPPFAAWSTGGLSTMPFALLVFVLYERLLGPRAPRTARGGGLTGVLALALLLLRAESAPWVLALGGAALAAGRVRREPARAGAAWRALALAFGGLALFVAWRTSYFGYPLPNTAYAKVAGSLEQVERGLYYLVRVFTSMPALALLVLGGAWAVWRERTPALAGAALLVFVTGAFIAAVGGDFMAMFRFVVPAVAPLAVLFAATLARMQSASPRMRLAAQLFAALQLAGAVAPALGWEPVRKAVNATLGAGVFQTQLSELRWQRFDARIWTDLGRFLKRVAPPGASLVSRGIGAVGYASDLTIHDRHGLVCLDVSHGGLERVRGAAGHDLMVGIRFFEPRQPTYGYAAIHTREDVERVNPPLVFRIFDKFGDAELTRVYRPVLVPIPLEETSFSQAPDFAERDFASRELYLVLAERVADPPASTRPENGWREPLLVPENVRPLP